MAVLLTEALSRFLEVQQQAMDAVEMCCLWVAPHPRAQRLVPSSSHRVLRIKTKLLWRLRREAFDCRLRQVPSQNCNPRHLATSCWLPDQFSPLHPHQGASRCAQVTRRTARWEWQGQSLSRPAPPMEIPGPRSSCEPELHLRWVHAAEHFASGAVTHPQGPLVPSSSRHPTAAMLNSNEETATAPRGFASRQVLQGAHEMLEMCRLSQVHLRMVMLEPCRCGQDRARAFNRENQGLSRCSREMPMPMMPLEVL